MITFNRIYCLIFILVLLAGCIKEGQLTDYTNDKNPVAAEYNIQLGLGYLEKGDVERAKYKLLIAIKQDPLSPDAKIAMAYFWEQTKNNKFAEEEYLKALKLKTKRGMVHNNYGVFLCGKGRFKEAEKHYKLALSDKNYPKMADIYENAGICAKKVREFTKARWYFEKAINSDQRKSSAFLSLIELNLLRGDCKEAYYWQKRFEKQHELTVDSALFGYRIADCLNDYDNKKRYQKIIKTQFPHYYRSLEG